MLQIQVKAMLLQSHHSLTTPINKRSNLVDRQIACLAQKYLRIKQGGNQYLFSQINVRIVPKIYKEQSEIYLHIMDLDKIEENLQLLDVNKKHYEEEKLQYIITYEDMEIHCEHLGKDLVKCFKYEISDFDQIRLQMIEVENSQCLKSIEQLFSIRKSTIIFLKDRGLLLKKYPFGVQMEICRLKLSEEFKWFLKILLKQINMEEAKEVINCINQYIILAKKCEKLLGLMDQSQPKAPKEDESLKRQMITESIMKDREDIVKIELKIQKLTSKINQISKRIQQYSSLKTQRLKDKKQTILVIQMLSQKIKCLQIVEFKQSQLKQQLRQISEAIDYLYSKNLNYENSRSQLNISLRSASRQKNQMLFYSDVSIPKFCESLVRSEVVTTPKNKLINFSSVKKPFLRIESRSKNKKRMSSPSWK